MFVTAGALTSRYDCFVIGSGPAGMTVALELAKAKRSVLLFESGELNSPRTDLPPTINFGHFPAGWWSRHSFRTLGGTSAVWGGWCATLTERDFNNPAVGVKWPITRAELLPYYRQAANVLDRSASIVDVEHELFPGFVYRPFSVNEESPTRFGLKYREVLENSTTTHVALGYSVLGLDATPSRSAVNAITYFHHESGQSHELTVSPSQVVIVAGGGIGNAQLLLQPRADGSASIGNESGQVGKYLMEHPHFVDAVECVLDVDLNRRRRPADFGNPIHALVPDDALSDRHQLQSCSVDCKDPNPTHEMARYLSKEQGRPFFHYHGTIRSEMRPSANNRVFLTGTRDRAGFYTTGVRCVLDANDFLIAETTLRLLGDVLVNERRGRVRINNDPIYREPTGGGHLMGTTRMGAGRSTSVVDRDCRVHGYRNLFVAGSSVFPTGGYANPTLTIVALALRLAETVAAIR